MRRSKIFVTKQNFIRTLEICFKKGWFFHKKFDNSHLKFGKMKKPKLKNSNFDGPFIVNVSQIEINIGKSEFAHIMCFY